MNNYKIPPREMIPPVYAAKGFDGSYDANKPIESLLSAVFNFDIDENRKKRGSSPSALAQGVIEQQLESVTTPRGLFTKAAGAATGNPLTGIPASYVAGEVYDVAAPLVNKAYRAVVENSDEYQQKQAEAAMRKAGVNPLAEEYASVGDYGIDDTVVGTALSEALRNDVGDYNVSDYTAPPDVLGMVNQAAQDSLSAKAAQQAAATYNDKDFNNALNAAIAEEIGTSVPATTAPAASVASTAATYNDKDGGNDSGQQAPAGGYASYSGEDVEASYSVPDSKPAGQSSGNWNTTARQASTTTNDSGSSSGGK